MKEIKTCEEYVLNELAEQKKKYRELDKASKVSNGIVNLLLTKLVKLEPFFNVKQTADGKKMIVMKYVFEDFDPEAFKMLSELFDLEQKEES